MCIALQRRREAQSLVCLLVRVTIESHFPDHPMLVWSIANGVVMGVSVCGHIMPLVISRYFGHDGGSLIVCLLVLLVLSL